MIRGQCQVSTIRKIDDFFALGESDDGYTPEVCRGCNTTSGVKNRGELGEAAVEDYKIGPGPVGPGQEAGKHFGHHVDVGIGLGRFDGEVAVFPGGQVTVSGDNHGGGSRIACQVGVVIKFYSGKEV